MKGIDCDWDRLRTDLRQLDAAPEMLEALEAVKAILPRSTDPMPHASVIDYARFDEVAAMVDAAIRKAKGEQER